MEGRHAWCGWVASVMLALCSSILIKKRESCSKGVLMIPGGKYSSSYDWVIMKVLIIE